MLLKVLWQLFGGERGVASLRFGFDGFVALGFGHDKEVQRKTNGSDTGKREKRCTISGMDDNKPSECGGQRRAYTLRCDYCALRDVKAASAAH
jgi:hypothetical protein